MSAILQFAAAVCSRLSARLVDPLRSEDREELFEILLRKYVAVAAMIVGCQSFAICGVLFLGTKLFMTPTFDSFSSVADITFLLCGGLWSCSHIVFYVTCRMLRDAPDLPTDVYLVAINVFMFGVQLALGTSTLPPLFAVVLNGSFAILFQSRRWKLHLVLPGAIFVLEWYRAVADFCDLWRPYIRDRHPLTALDFVLAIAFSAIVLLFIFGCSALQTAEQRKQVIRAAGAVKTATSVAQSLGRYDTVAARDTVTSGVVRAADMREKQRKYIDGSVTVTGNTDFTGSTATAAPSALSKLDGVAAMSQDEAVSLDPVLREAFIRLVDNLDAYRPHLPNWLLQPSSCDDADAGCGEFAFGTDPADEALHSTRRRVAVSDHETLNPEYPTSRRSSRMILRRSSSSAMDGGGEGRKSTSRETPRHHAGPAPSRRLTTAAVEYWFVGAAEIDAGQRTAALSALVDAVHKVANDSRGAVHCFANGEVTLTWNAASRAVVPEAKAARAMTELRAAVRNSSTPLANVRFCAAISTGVGHAELAGTSQRVVASDTSVRWRLRAMLRFALSVARTTPADGPADATCLIVCDSESTDNVDNMLLGPAGLISYFEPGRPGPHHTPKLAHGWTTAAVFDVVGPRSADGKADEEWLYAMERVPLDEAVAAFIVIASCYLSPSGLPHCANGDSPGRCPSSCRRNGSCIATMQSAMAAVDEASPRPLSAYWRLALSKTSETVLNFDWLVAPH